MSLNKKTSSRLFIIAGLLIISVAIGTYYYLNKPVKDIEKIKTAFVLNSNELLTAFETNYTEANNKYIDEVIEISGKVQSINTTDNYTNMLLANDGDFFGVNCSFSELDTTIINEQLTGKSITIKGRCTGYLDDVLINQCIILKIE